MEKENTTYGSSFFPFETPAGQNTETGMWNQYQLQLKGFTWTLIIIINLF